MNPILFLSLVIILGAALPWWPYSASGRLRNSRAMTTVIPEASQKAAMKLCDGNSETHPGAMQGDATWQKEFETLRRQLEQRSVAQPTKERRVIQSGIIEGKSFSIFDDGSIEIQTGSGIKQFKDFAELRASWGEVMDPNPR